MSPFKTEADLLAAARGGDHGAFAQLIEAHRADLHAHCYRMLGSPHDADDAFQDAALRAWRALDRFEGRSAFNSWLYRIATNVCLDHIAERSRRVLPMDFGPASDPHDGQGAPLVEAVWVEPYPDRALGLGDGLVSPAARYERRESVELAFVAALQHLPPLQRAVVLCREVLGLSAAEMASSLETTVAAVNSALQRARQSIEGRLPAESQQETLRSLGDERLRRIVESYVDAWERGDAETILAMLAEDVTVTMPPMPTWFRGHAAAAVFLREWAFAKRWAAPRARFEAGPRRVRLVPTRASGQVAFGAYTWTPDAERYLPMALQVLSLRGEHVVEIDGYVAPGLFEPMGLPPALDV